MPYSPAQDAREVLDKYWGDSGGDRDRVTIYGDVDIGYISTSTIPPDLRPTCVSCILRERGDQRAWAGDAGLAMPHATQQAAETGLLAVANLHAAGGS